MKNNIEKQEQKGVTGWIDKRLPIFTFMNHNLRDYPTPKNLNYFWNFGSLAGITLVIMIVTGILLACLLYTSPSPRDMRRSRMPSSA